MNSPDHELGEVWAGVQLDGDAELWSGMEAALRHVDEDVLVLLQLLVCHLSVGERHRGEELLHGGGGGGRLAGRATVGAVRLCVAADDGVDGVEDVDGGRRRRGAGRRPPGGGEAEAGDADVLRAVEDAGGSEVVAGRRVAGVHLQAEAGPTPGPTPGGTRPRVDPPRVEQHWQRGPVALDDAWHDVRAHVQVRDENVRRTLQRRVALRRAQQRRREVLARAERAVARLHLRRAPRPARPRHHKVLLVQVQTEHLVATEHRLEEVAGVGVVQRDVKTHGHTCTHTHTTISYLT